MGFELASLVCGNFEGDTEAGYPLGEKGESNGFGGDILNWIGFWPTWKTIDNCETVWKSIWWRSGPTRSIFMWSNLDWGLTNWWIGVITCLEILEIWQLMQGLTKCLQSFSMLGQKNAFLTSFVVGRGPGWDTLWSQKIAAERNPLIIKGRARLVEISQTRERELPGRVIFFKRSPVFVDMNVLSSSSDSCEIASVWKSTSVNKTKCCPSSMNLNFLMDSKAAKSFLS